MKKLLWIAMVGLALGNVARAQYDYCPPRQSYSYDYWWYRSPSGYTIGSYSYRARPTPAPYYRTPRSGYHWWYNW